MKKEKKLLMMIEIIFFYLIINIFKQLRITYYKQKINLMGVLDFIKKLSKMMTKLSFSSLSTRYKILLALAAAVLLKYFFGRSADTKNIIKVPLS
jgi:hypothetical protein